MERERRLAEMVAIFIKLSDRAQEVILDLARGLDYPGAFTAAGHNQRGNVVELKTAQRDKKSCATSGSRKTEKRGE